MEAALFFLPQVSNEYIMNIYYFDKKKNTTSE